MINIFFNYYENGPRKVIDNLSKGLRLIDKDFCKNKNIFENSIYLSGSSYTTNHDPSKVIIGPNIWFEDNIVIDQQYKYFLVPSRWVYDLVCEYTSIDKDKIFIWPVGIDTNIYSDTSNLEKKIDCLLYYKNRQEDELQRIIELLNSRNLSYKVVRYGTYNEEEFISFIKICRFSIILVNTESQGIAIQEIMSSNIPLFVWNKTEWTYKNYRCQATSVPYWSEICGVYFSDVSEVEKKFQLFIENIKNYKPRNYILKNLNLEKSASDLIDLF